MTRYLVVLAIVLAACGSAPVAVAPTATPTSTPRATPTPTLFVTPTAPAPACAGRDQSALIARMNAYNAPIAALAAVFAGSVTVVGLFTGSGPLVSTITVSADGFHPSDAGYALIADRFVRAIGESGIALR